MARKTTLPSTLPGLRAWLKGSKQGRTLLSELVEKAIEERIEDKCRACENIRPYPKVLVVLRRLWGGDPGVQVSAEEGVSVRFLELPDVRSETPEIERQLDELMELLLPRSWRHMIDPQVIWSKRITSRAFRGISLTEWLRYAELAEALREIRSVYGRATEQP